MTDYNDGKWHGWNGGECPVHPETVVDTVWENGTRDGYKASGFDWNYEGPSRVIVFRVVKEHKEPVATEYQGECWAYHYDHTDPTTASHNVGGDCVHGTWTATHVDGKLQSFTWTADQ